MSTSARLGLGYVDVSQVRFRLQTTSAGLGWIRLDKIRLIRLDHPRLDWVRLDQTGLDQIRLGQV